MRLAVRIILVMILYYIGCSSGRVCTWSSVGYYNPLLFSPITPTPQDTLHITNDAVLVLRPSTRYGLEHFFRSIIVDPSGSLVIINTNVTLTERFQVNGSVTVSGARLEAPSITFGRSSQVHVVGNATCRRMPMASWIGPNLDPGSDSVVVVTVDPGSKLYTHYLNLSSIIIQLLQPPTGTNKRGLDFSAPSHGDKDLLTYAPQVLFADQITGKPRQMSVIDPNPADMKCKESVSLSEWAFVPLTPGTTSGMGTVSSEQWCIVQSGFTFSILMGQQALSACGRSHYICAPGWIGSSCSVALCLPGPEPVNNCGGHGVCFSSPIVTTPVCQCSPGWSGSDCSSAQCPGAPVACGGSTRGSCSTAGGIPHCVCVGGYSGADCTTPPLAAGGGHMGSEDPEPTTPSPAKNEASLSSSRSPTSAPSSDGLTATHPSASSATSSTLPSSSPGQTWLAVLPSTNPQITKSSEAPAVAACTSVCQNGALCDPHSGKCVCDARNWKGASCNIAVCEGDTDIDCSGNGRCDPTVLPHRCICPQHWKGLRCDIPICPSDCSERGQCSGRSTPPSCACYAGWTGAACNISASVAMINGRLDAAQNNNNTNSGSKAHSGGLSAGVITAIVCVVVLVVLAAIIVAIWIGPKRFRSLVADKPAQGPAYSGLRS